MREAKEKSGPGGPQRKYDRGYQQVSPPSVAEQLAALRRAIEAEEKQLAGLKSELTNPESEYAKAEAAFTAIDKRLEQKKKLIADKTGTPAEIKRAQDTLEDTKKLWSLARNRFDLQIDDRKTLNLQIATLEKKLKHEREAIKKLDGTASTAPKDDDEGTKQSPAPAVAATAPTDVATPADPAAASAPKPVVSLPGAKTDVVTANAAGSEQAAPAVAAREKKPVDRALVKAEKEAQVKSKAAKEAEQDEASITERLNVLKNSIALQQKSLETAQKLADNANETRNVLAQELQTRSLAGAPADMIQRTVEIAPAKPSRPFVKYRSDVRERSQELSRLQAELNRATRPADRGQEDRRGQGARVGGREPEDRGAPQPVRSPQRASVDLIDHGPKILAVLLAMLLLHWLTRQFSRRIVQVMSRAGLRGTEPTKSARPAPTRSSASSTTPSRSRSPSAAP